MNWIEQEREKGEKIETAQALAQLATEWQEKGPKGHPFERYYKATAEEMVARMAQIIAHESGRYDSEEWFVPLGACKVAVTPDRVVRTPDGVVHVQRIRTGRETKSEQGKPIYALLRRGAEARYPAQKISVEAFYMASGSEVVIEGKNDHKHINDYASAIEAIESGEFEPTPSVRDCPNCQCYFMCRG
jgi:hypothetical protein